MYGMFTYIWQKKMVHVGKYTSPMGAMGDGRHGDKFGPRIYKF